MDMVELKNLDLDEILGTLTDDQASQLKKCAESAVLKKALKDFHAKSNLFHSTLSDHAENLYHKINHELSIHPDNNFFKQEAKHEIDVLSDSLKNLLKKVDSGLFITWNSKDPDLIDHFNDLKIKISHTLYHFLGHSNNEKAATGLYLLVVEKK